MESQCWKLPQADNHLLVQVLQLWISLDMISTVRNFLNVKKSCHPSKWLLIVILSGNLGKTEHHAVSDLEMSIRPTRMSRCMGMRTGRCLQSQADKLKRKRANPACRLRRTIKRGRRD